MAHEGIPADKLSNVLPSTSPTSSSNGHTVLSDTDSISSCSELVVINCSEDRQASRCQLARNNEVVEVVSHLEQQIIQPRTYPRPIDAGKGNARLTST
jgi:hypothetical protein